MTRALTIAPRTLPATGMQRVTTAVVQHPVAATHPVSVPEPDTKLISNQIHPTNDGRMQMTRPKSYSALFRATQ